MTVCTVTILDEKIPCTLPADHDGQHKGGGWVWWHGNGEECQPGCAKCEQIAAHQ